MKDFMTITEVAVQINYAVSSLSDSVDNADRTMYETVVLYLFEPFL